MTTKKAAKKARSDKGTKRALTRKEDAISEALQALRVIHGWSGKAIALLAEADALGKTTDNRRKVAKRGRR